MELIQNVALIPNINVTDIVELKSDYYSGIDMSATNDAMKAQLQILVSKKIVIS